MVAIGHGVCVGSWERYEANVVPHALGPLFPLTDQTSIADAYNMILTEVAPMGLDLLILQHDDLELTDPDTAAKLAAAAAEPDVALIGVAGARGVTSLAWWNYDTVGHQQTDGGLIDFGPRTGDVDALEGSVLVFTRWAIANLRFDPLPGFHGYDVLIARKAVDAGRRVVVADIATHHHTQVGFKSQSSHDDWLNADRYFRERIGTACG